MCRFVLLLCLCVVGTSFGNVQNKNSNSEKPAKFKGNILCLMPIASPSHHIWNRVLMEAMANRGYNVTALSVDVDKDPVPNLHYIHMEGVYDVIYQTEKFDLMEYASLSIVDSIRELFKYFGAANRGSLDSKGFQVLLNYPDNFHFDLVIYDYAAAPGLLGFLPKFNYPPLVGITAFMNPPNTMDANGNPIFPSLLPYYATKLPKDMNFWQRSLNLFYYALDNYGRRSMVKELDKYSKEKFGEDLPFIGELEKRIEVMLVNIHPSMDVPEPLLPSVIPVGGLQVKEPKELPKEIKNFIESSKKGAVLFSLGSNVKSVMLGEEKIQMFIRALSRFPDYHFLWKFEDDGLKVPKNIMVQKWLSQNDILGHPKVKLFMTHSGLLSTQESTWHGVPMLGIPFFADQHTNIKKSMDAGVAEKLDIFNLKEEDIYNVLNRMLSNSNYSKAMSTRSSLFRDRPRPPLDEAVWWCEYVLRHKGASHLRSQAATMCPFTLFMWDLLAVWGSALILAVTGTALVLKKLLCSKKSMRTSDELRTKKNK